MMAIAPPLQSENDFGPEKDRQGSALNTPTGRWMHGWMNGWMDNGWMIGWMDGWMMMDGRMDSWM